MTQQKKKDGLNIELTEEVAQGAYSNLAIINHSPSEFVVDFIQMMPGVAKAKVKSRVILTPQHAKRLMKALVEKDTNKYGKMARKKAFKLYSWDNRVMKLLEFMQNQ